MRWLPRIVPPDRRQAIALAVLFGLVSVLSLVRLALKGSLGPPASPLLTAPKELVYPPDEYRAKGWEAKP